MSASLIVSYGPEGRYRVEFRLNARGDVEGRYLPSADGFGGTTEWDVREPDYDDADHVATLNALHEVLTRFEGAGFD